MTDPPGILIVDDDTSVLRMLRRGLEDFGHAVFPAASPSEALKLAEARRPALAILDIDLKAEIGGFGLCQQLGEIPGYQPDVVFISGTFTESVHRDKGYELGAVAFSLKPVPLAWLRQEVEFFFREPQPLLQLARPDGGPASPAAARKVLVVEDVEENAKVVCLYLEQDGFVPYWAAKGAHAVGASKKIRPDAIVLDLGLPDLDGTEVHRLLRLHPATRRIPIVAWTASKDGRIETSFLNDADADYVIKGVHSMGSVAARIHRLLDKRGKTQPDAPLERGRVRLDTVRRRLWSRGRLACDKLGPKRYGVLWLLFQHDGPVSREELQEAVWGGKGDTNAVEMTVARLRQDLGDKKEEIIVTTPEGYRLVG